MAMDGLPEGVASPGRVPGQLLQAAPILKQRRRRNRGEIAKEGSILGISVTGGKYRGRGAPRGATGQPGGSLARPRVGHARDPSGVPVVAPLPSLDVSGSFRVPDFLSDFSRFFGALLMAGKPEIQKQQKTTTGSRVHWVNRLVQICSNVYESSSKTWQSHTKHAWSKQKL